MKIELYKTVTADSSKELDEKVNELIKKGFQPYGSPYFIAPENQAMTAHDISAFNQAMVECND